MNFIPAFFLLFSFKSLGNGDEENNFRDLCSKGLGVEGDPLCSAPQKSSTSPHIEGKLNEVFQVPVPCARKKYLNKPRNEHKRSTSQESQESQVQDEFLIVEANKGNDVSLPCQLCTNGENSRKNPGENSDENSRASQRENSGENSEEEKTVVMRWFRSYRINEEVEEILQFSHFNRNDPKFAFEVNTLKILNVDERDSALYFCTIERPSAFVNLEDFQLKSTKFNFILHVNSEGLSGEVLVGSKDEFNQFERKHLEPLNRELKSQMDGIHGEETQSFRVEIGWGVWGECNSCGRLGTERVKRRGGQCRLIIPYESKEESKSGRKFNLNFPCWSPLIGSFLPAKPQLVNKLAQIPLFSQIKSCNHRTCQINLESSSCFQLPKSNLKEISSRHKILYGGSFTFKCSNSGLSSSVVWAFERKFLGPHFLRKARNGRVKINENFELEIRQAFAKDSGQYSCFLDVKLTNVFSLLVVEKPSGFSMMLKEVFVYVGSFTVICTILWIFLSVISIHAGLKILHKRKQAKINAIQV